MSTIQKTITIYMRGKTLPDKLAMQVFIGMIETGEATYDDFLDVGGWALAAAVMTATQAAREVPA